MLLELDISLLIRWIKLRDLKTLKPQFGRHITPFTRSWLVNDLKSILFFSSVKLGHGSAGIKTTLCCAK